MNLFESIETNLGILKKGTKLAKGKNQPRAPKQMTERAILEAASAVTIGEGKVPDLESTNIEGIIQSLIEMAIHEEEVEGMAEKPDKIFFGSSGQDNYYAEIDIEREGGPEGATAGIEKGPEKGGLAPLGPTDLGEPKVKSITIYDVADEEKLKIENEDGLSNAELLNKIVQQLRLDSVGFKILTDLDLLKKDEAEKGAEAEEEQGEEEAAEKDKEPTDKVPQGEEHNEPKDKAQQGEAPVESVKETLDGTAEHQEGHFDPAGTADKDHEMATVAEKGKKPQFKCDKCGTMMTAALKMPRDEECTCGGKYKEVKEQMGAPGESGQVITPAPSEGVKELPKINIAGKQYYVDNKLQQVRAVDNPHDYKAFDDLDQESMDAVITVITAESVGPEPVLGIDPAQKANESKVSKKELAAAAERTKSAMSFLRKIHKATTMDAMHAAMDAIEKAATKGDIDDKQETRLKDAWARRKEIVEKNPKAPEAEPSKEEEKGVEANEATKYDDPQDINKVKIVRDYGPNDEELWTAYDKTTNQKTGTFTPEEAEKVFGKGWQEHIVDEQIGQGAIADEGTVDEGIEDPIRAIRDAIQEESDAKVSNTPIQQAYLTFTEGTSNKYHQFAMFQAGDEYVAGNAYGRIGKTISVIVFSKGDEATVKEAYEKKIASKTKKGYVAESIEHAIPEAENKKMVEAMTAAGYEKGEPGHFDPEKRNVKPVDTAAMGKTGDPKEMPPAPEGSKTMAVAGGEEATLTPKVTKVKYISGSNTPMIGKEAIVAGFEGDYVLIYFPEVKKGWASKAKNLQVVESKEKKCPKCAGEGQTPDKKTCDRCKGAGKLEEAVETPASKTDKQAPDKIVSDPKKAHPKDEDKYQKELDALLKELQAKKLTQAEYDAKMEELKQKHAAEVEVAPDAKNPKELVAREKKTIELNDDTNVGVVSPALPGVYTGGLGHVGGMNEKEPTPEGTDPNMRQYKPTPEESKAFDETSTRKASSWDEVDTTDDPTVLALAKKLPVISAEELLKDESAVPTDSFTKETPQWFVLQFPGENYLIDTEGYDYARYALRLEGVEFADEGPGGPQKDKGLPPDRGEMPDNDMTHESIKLGEGWKEAMKALEIGKAFVLAEGECKGLKITRLAEHKYDIDWSAVEDAVIEGCGGKTKEEKKWTAIGKAMKKKKAKAHEGKMPDLTKVPEEGVINDLLEKHGLKE